MAHLDSSNGLQRQVLVPILIVGGLLCFAQSVSPEGAGSPLALAALTSTGLTTWIIAGWVTRGVSPRSMFALCLWADAAIVVIDLSRDAGQGELTALAMFALPSVMTGLYGSAWTMTAQALAVAGGSVTVLERLDLSFADPLTQSGGALLATISPAVAVLVLRRRLDAALARERQRQVVHLPAPHPDDDSSASEVPHRQAAGAGIPIRCPPFSGGPPTVTRRCAGDPAGSLRNRSPGVCACPPERL
jgi:hypothetical protein